VHLDPHGPPATLTLTAASGLGGSLRAEAGNRILPEEEWSSRVLFLEGYPTDSDNIG